MTDFPVGVDQVDGNGVPGTHEIDQIWQATATSPIMVYKGNGRWNTSVSQNSQELANYYSRTEVDVLIAGLQTQVDENNSDIETNTSNATSALALAQAAIPSSEKAAADGVASLGSDGKVPNAQLPDAIVSGVPSWGDITGKPTEFTPEAHTHVAADVTDLQALLDAKLNASSYTAADVLTKLLTVDGPGTALDADLLDGLHASSFALAGHDHTGVYAQVTHTHSQYHETDVNSLPTATNYEVGTYLFGAEPGTGVQLNASVTLYMDDNDDTCGCCADVDYRRAVTTTATANTVLSGTWRFRGRAAGGGGLYQRVA